MNNISPIFLFLLILIGDNLSAQITKNYVFNSDSVQVFDTPNPVNSYYLPYDISNITQPMYAEPFTTNVSFPTLAQDLYGPAGNFSNTIFGGDNPGILGFGYTATSTIINSTFSSIDFPITLEADFFNRSSQGNHNESYFWLGNSNYTHFNPSNSILPSPDVQEGILIGGLPERSIISHSRNYLLPSIALINKTHNFAGFNSWYKLKVILDVTEDGRLIIYNIFIDGNCVLTDPIIVEKSDDLNLNSFNLAICVDDFAKDFKVTKNANLFTLPDIEVCANSRISLNSNFTQSLCLDFDYLWDLPGSEQISSSIKSPTNIEYLNQGVFQSSLKLTNGAFTKVIPFNVVVSESPVTQIISTICPSDSVFFNNQWIHNEGSYRQVLSSHNGCDSLIILQVHKAKEYSSSKDISLCQGDSLLVDNHWIHQSGQYKENLIASNGCDSIVTINISFSESIKTNLEFFICEGDVIEIGQEKYYGQGNFIQTYTSSAGCDSTLNISIKFLRENLLYDFNNCSAIMGSTNMDYSEFTSAFAGITCGTMSISNLYRSNPLVNKHSCTPGQYNTLAMCVDSDTGCNYLPGNDKSVIFKIDITPEDAKFFQISKLRFFEKSPNNYNWINGPTGVNNYATKFGFRVLKNGYEIYRQTDLSTARDWNEHKIGFMDNEAFVAKEKATYQFEFFPYCPVGNSSSVSVWDLENISIFTTCLDKEIRILAGAVTDTEGNPLVNVNVLKQKQLDIENIMTDQNGNFAISDIVNSEDCEISVQKNDDYLNGVSTLDLVLIQRHILGLGIFDKPRQYVAADVNNDARISAMDLVELRKLILGVTDKFSHNKSWRFITELPDFGRTSRIDVNEKYTIEKGVKDFMALNFTGIKIGDIDDSSSLHSGTENRIDNTVTLNFDIEKISGGQCQINFYTPSTFELQGFQSSMEIEGLEGFEVKNGQINLEDQDINVSRNNLKISFIAPKTLVISNLLPLFSLVTSKTLISPSSITLNESFENEMYDNNLSKKKIKLASLEKFGTLDLLKAKPNPFNNNTLVEFISHDSNPVIIEVFTILGNLVFTKRFESIVGYNAVEITSDHLGRVPGVYFLKLNLGNESKNVKLILE